MSTPEQILTDFPVSPDLIRLSWKFHEAPAAILARFIARGFSPAITAMMLHRAASK